jgi:hypothetical protein
MVVELGLDHGLNVGWTWLLKVKVITRNIIKKEHHKEHHQEGTSQGTSSRRNITRNISKRNIIKEHHQEGTSQKTSSRNIIWFVSQELLLD